jgi:acylphosphatase
MLTDGATTQRRCIQCLISGRVQGVWYRASTQQQARALGITGFAHNLSDGRVEVLACGDEVALKALQDWLWQGPDHAAVSHVDCETAHPDPVPSTFTTA